MGRIYPVSYPDSVAPGFGVPVTQFFQDLKLSYYWTQAKNTGGQKVFAFSNLSPGGVTTKFPYYYVLPMVVGKLVGAPTCPTPPSGVLPYTSGPAASKAVYDCQTDRTWVADGNLAGAAQNQNTFGITGNIKIISNRGTIFKVPKIDKGAMLFATADAMIANMRTKPGYLGSIAWQLPPDPASLKDFAAHMGLVSADSTLMFKGSTGHFKNLQPFYYWGCQQDQPGMIQSPCTAFALPNGNIPMQWTFNFDDGFQGTAATIQPFFVMVYFPVPLPCSNPMQCCVEAGGHWSNGHCQNPM